MKKYLKTVLSIVFVLALTLSVVSCEKNEENLPSDDTSSVSNKDENELVSDDTSLRSNEEKKEWSSDDTSSDKLASLLQQRIDGQVSLAGTQGMSIGAVNYIYDGFTTESENANTAGFVRAKLDGVKEGYYGWIKAPTGTPNAVVLLAEYKVVEDYYGVLSAGEKITYQIILSSNYYDGNLESLKADCEAFRDFLVANPDALIYLKSAMYKSNASKSEVTVGYSFSYYSGNNLDTLYDQERVKIEHLCGYAGQSLTENYNFIPLKCDGDSITVNLEPVAELSEKLKFTWNFPFGNYGYLEDFGLFIEQDMPLEVAGQNLMHLKQFIIDNDLTSKSYRSIVYERAQEAIKKEKGTSNE